MTVSNFSIQSLTKTGAHGTLRGFSITWDDEESETINHVSYRRPDGEWVYASVRPGSRLVEVLPAEEGEYLAQMYYQLPGLPPSRVTATLNLDFLAEDSAIPLPTPRGLELVGVDGTRLGNAREWVGRDVRFSWYKLRGTPTRRPRLGTAPGDQLLENTIVELYAGATFLRREVLPVEQNEWVYTYAKNEEDGLRRSFTLKLRFRDVLGRLSDPRPITVSNPAPGAPTAVDPSGSPAVLDVLELTQEVDGLDFRLGRPLTVDPDLRGVLVWMGDTAGFSPDAEATLVADIPLTQDTGAPWVAGRIPLNVGPRVGTTRYFKAAFYDAFTKAPSELNVSAAVAHTFVSTAPKISTDTGVTGLSDADLESNLAELAAASGAITFENTFSAAATLDCNNCFPSAAGDEFQVDFALTVATDGVDVGVRTDEAASPSAYDAGAADYDYHFDGYSHAGTPLAQGSGGTGTSRPLITAAAAGANDVGNSSAEYLRGKIHVRFAGSASARCMLRFETEWLNPSTVACFAEGTLVRNAAHRIQSLQFVASSGNLAGYVKVKAI